MELEHKVVQKSLWCADPWLRAGLCFATCLFPLLVLTVNHADSYVLAAVSLIGIYLACRWQRYGIDALRGDEKALLTALVFYFVIALVSYGVGLHSETGFHILGRYLRLVFVIPAYLAFRWARVPGAVLAWGLIIGTIMTGVAALIESLAPPGAILLRATGDTMAIVFGDLALLGGFMGVVTCIYFHQRRPVLAAVISLMALVFGISASILSGTRGAWLSLPVLGAVAIIGLVREFSQVKLISVAALVCAAIGAVYIIPATGVAARIDAGVDNLRDYFANVRQVGRAHTAHIGCVSSRENVNLISRANVTAVPAGGAVHVVQDKSALADAGFAKQCAGAHALEFTDNDPQRHQRFTLARSVISLAHPIDAEILVRGSGKLEIEGGTFTSFEAGGYRKMTLKGGAWRKNITMALKPGEHLWIVPLARIPGEYTKAFAESSVASRLEMWRAAWRIFLDHPLLGAGTGAYQNEALKQVERGIAAPVAAQFDHPHNQYLAELADRGVIGLAALIAMLTAPACIFVRALNAGAARQRFAALAGMMMVVGFTVFGLTETIFIHSLTITYYVIFVALYAAMLHPVSPLPLDSKR